MGTAEEHEKRSQEISDITRRFAVTLNSAGIGLVFTVAGTLSTRGISACWAFLPIISFIFGLLFNGISLFLAKHRELKRRDAAEAGNDHPEKFKKWRWRSFTWDLVAFGCFAIGAFIGLWKLSYITI